jgi:hypothetical protein
VVAVPSGRLVKDEGIRAHMIITISHYGGNMLWRGFLEMR